MRYLPDRYKVWNKILVKHEKKWKETGEANLAALYSNQCQVDRLYKKGMLDDDEYNDLTSRYLTLKAQVDAHVV